MSIAHHDEAGDRSKATDIDDEEGRSSIDAPSASPSPSPLEFLYTEHLRQRQFAKLLCLIADGVINRRTIAEAIRFIEGDLAQHILDEEISFFPLLRPLCQAEDRIEEILGLLADEHREDEENSAKILEILRAAESGEPPGAGDRATLRAFAEHLRRHLALENGVLLPLAEARMTPDALRLLSQSIAMRRGGALS